MSVGLPGLVNTLPLAGSSFDVREKLAAQGGGVNADADVRLRLQNVDVNDDALRASGVRYRL
jgi:hypothetical protein